MLTKTHPEFDTKGIASCGIKEEWEKQDAKDSTGKSQRKRGNWFCYPQRQTSVVAHAMRRRDGDRNIRDTTAIRHRNNETAEREAKGGGRNHQGIKEEVP